MSKVKWPCEIPAAGIFGVPLYYSETNRHAFKKPQRFASVDRRLFIALAAGILDGIESFDLHAINTNGIYNDRNIRGSSSKSTHAYGIAIDIAGFKLDEYITFWVDDDLHKGFLSATATGIMMKYFPDVITWDVGQWQGGFPHSYSDKTKALHKDHYHLNVSPESRFKAETDKWHLAAVRRVLARLGYVSTIAFQDAAGLRPDGIAGAKTTQAIVEAILNL